jgi:DNA-directed RNA polymerase subunit H (RpoH/RPB5)
MIEHNQLDMLLTRDMEDERDPGEDDSSVITSSTAHSAPSRGNKIYIRYALSKQVRPNMLNELVEELFSGGTLTKQDTLIIVVKESVNSTLTDAIVELWERDKIFVVVHHLPRLQYNIMDHVIVPRHIVMEEEETNALLKKYNATGTHMPNITRFDPVAQAICLRPGQMCKILRPSKTAVNAEFYRMCV